MKRSILALVVIVLPLLTGCASNAATAGPRDPAAAASAPAVAVVSPSAGAGGPLDAVAAALVPAIVPGGDLEAGATAGAYAVAIDGAFGRTTASGQASCSWGGDPANAAFTALAGEPTELFGEQVEVQIGAGRSPELRRADGARYIPSGGTITDPTPIGDVLVVRATSLAVDQTDPLPVGEDKASYYQALGGRSDTAGLDVAIAWRCAAPTPSPSATDTAEDPTPVCPPSSSASPGPVGPLVLATAKDQAEGVPFSADYVTCTDEGSTDGDWNVPDTALAAGGTAPLTVSLGGSGSLVSVGAFYAPATSDTTPTSTVTLTVRPGSTPDTFLIDPPPAGDWALVVSTVISDPDHGRVADATFIYRVKVSH
jgi:hypothetical protein